MAMVGASGVAGTKVGAATAGAATAGAVSGSGDEPWSILSLACPKSAVWFCPSWSRCCRLVSR